MIESPKLMFQLLDILSQPIQVFDPDGTVIFANQAGLDFTNIKDASLHIGKYNLLRDPVCDAIFGHEKIARGFRGETVIWRDVSVPIDDVVNRGLAKEKPFEAAYTDVSLLPVFDDDKLAYVINTFSINRIYQGLPEVANAKEYIDGHWLEKFDAQAVAGAVNLSGSGLYHLFKRQTGMTPKEYYNRVKLGHIKEKLQDKSLTVAEAFSLCGEDSRGRFAKTFKELTGITPTEYRNSL